MRKDLIHKFDEMSYDGFELYDRLYTEHTGLSTTLFVDSNKCYVNEYEPVLFVSNKLPYQKRDGYIAIALSNTPKILHISGATTLTKRNILDILDFIKNNYKILLDIAHEKIDIYDAVPLFKHVIKESDLYLNDICTPALNEMGTLYPKNTGFKRKIWIDDGETYMQSGHSLRLKIEDFDSKSSREWPAINIYTLDVYNNQNKKNKRPIIDSNTIYRVKRFIEENFNIIISVSKKEINFEQFKNEIVKIDEYGKPINEHLWQPVYKGTVFEVYSNRFNLIRYFDNTYNIYDADYKKYLFNYSISSIVAYEQTSGYYEFYAKDIEGKHVFAYARLQLPIDKQK